MTTDLAEQLDLAPEVRLIAHAFRGEFGYPPHVLWRVPGTVTLLAGLTVATPWGAIAAAALRPDGDVEVVRLERPGQRERRPPGARGGAALLVTARLPSGTGVGTDAATRTAIRLCLGEDADAAGDGTAEGQAAAGARRLPFDLASAGLRLMVIDTRIRGVPRPDPDEAAPLDAATAALEAGDMRAFGELLTAAHRGLDCEEAQDIAVTTALRLGALGARAITDGPGRPVCALVPAARLGDVRAAVAGSFDRRGLRAPRFLTFTPAGGPSRTGGDQSLQEARR